jgi:hypothetical protein
MSPAHVSGIHHHKFVRQTPLTSQRIGLREEWCNCSAVGPIRDHFHLANAASLSAQGILCLDDSMIESARSLGMNVLTV